MYVKKLLYTLFFIITLNIIKAIPSVLIIRKQKVFQAVISQSDSILTY